MAEDLRNPDRSVGRALGSALSIFWRSFRAAIALEDKGVEFVSKVGTLEVKRKFKLKDMVPGDKLEL